MKISEFIKRLEDLKEVAGYDVPVMLPVDCPGYNEEIPTYELAGAELSYVESISEDREVFTTHNFGNNPRIQVVTLW